VNSTIAKVATPSELASRPLNAYSKPEQKLWTYVFSFSKTIGRRGREGT